MTMVTTSDLRTAQQVILVGEVFRLYVELRTRQPEVSADWELIGTADALAELEAAGQKAVDKAFVDEKYQVTVEAQPQGALLYRVTGYGRMVPRSWWTIGSLPGSNVEDQLLDALTKLTTRVKEIAGEATGVALAATGRWKPGPGLSIVSGIGSGGPKELEARIHEVIGRRRRLRLLSLISGAAGAVMLAVGLVFSLIGDVRVFGFGLMLYAALALFFGFMSWTSMAGTEQELTDLRDQQDLSDLLDEPLERRAQKLFQVHSHQLRRYYDQALRQRGVIFFIGLLCILAGFGIIIAALWFLVQGDSKDLSEQIVIATLGAVGGVLGNFIAVVYLRMFTETVKSIGGFHDRLVLTHHLHFANFLAAKVAEPALRDRTLAHMAQTMAILDPEHQGVEVSHEDGAPAQT